MGNFVTKTNGSRWCDLSRDSMAGALKARAGQRAATISPHTDVRSSARERKQSRARQIDYTHYAKIRRIRERA
jgi:hypothetical protein